MGLLGVGPNRALLALLHRRGLDLVGQGGWKSTSRVRNIHSNLNSRPRQFLPPRLNQVHSNLWDGSRRSNLHFFYHRSSKLGRPATLRVTSAPGTPPFGLLTLLLDGSLPRGFLSFCRRLLSEFFHIAPPHDTFLLGPLAHWKTPQAPKSAPDTFEGHLGILLNLFSTLSRNPNTFEALERHGRSSSCPRWAPLREGRVRIGGWSGVERQFVLQLVHRAPGQGQLSPKDDLVSETLYFYSENTKPFHSESDGDFPSRRLFRVFSCDRTPNARRGCRSWRRTAALPVRLCGGRDACAVSPGITQPSADSFRIFVTGEVGGENAGIGRFVSGMTDKGGFLYFWFVVHVPTKRTVDEATLSCSIPRQSEITLNGG